MPDQRDLLITEMHELLEKADSIEHQLEMAEARHIEEDHTIDEVWKAKARYALRATRREVSNIQHKIAVQKRAFEHRRQLSFERQFVDISRLHLDPETYDHILQQASEAVDSIEIEHWVNLLEVNKQTGA
tara:strand:- start:1077 stop:1466 length:390 start_codon:yes stop_codon:yes gene_type:complete